MAFIFNEIIHRPLFNILVWFYNLSFNDLGVAIILLTLLVRIILFPFFQKSLKHQRLLQELQPQIKQIQEKHKADKEKQTRAIMELYKTSRVNPFTPLLLLLIQLPVLIGLYRIFVNGFSEEALNALYSFVTRPIVLNHSLLGIIDLNHPNILVATLATLTQYLQGQLSLTKPRRGETLSPQEKASRQMVYFLPAITLIFLFNLPAAIGIYWIATTVFSIIQQMLVNRSKLNEGTSRTSHENN